MRTALRTCTCAVAGVLAIVGTAHAVAPGPIDGKNIPSNFGGANELAAQTNNTGFGDQSLGTGDFTPGSEMDALYLAKDNDYLYVGITGNLERNGHEFVIFIDVDFPGFFDGQQELRSENVDGPPYSIQKASREVVIVGNDVGTTTDDTWEYGSNGTMLPCEADFAITVDVYGGTMSVSEYTLFDPGLGAVGTTDPTPDNPNDPLLNLYAVRNFIGQTAINDGNDVIESLQLGNDYGPGGFDDTNTTGVTSTDATDANVATTGMELAIPLTNFQGVDDLNIMVAIVDGSDTAGGLFVPQVFPSITDPDACTSSFVIRQDLSSQLTCLPVDIATLPTFTGSADGHILASEYGAVVTDVQECPTTYGDQQFDENATTFSGGSEADVLYATNDDKFLYIGITGNLEANGNQMILLVDTDPDGADLGTNGRELDMLGNFQGISAPGAGGAIGGLANNGGDALPEDINSNAVNFNFAFQMNGSGGNYYLDMYNFETLSFSYVGRTTPNANNGGVLVEGTNPEGILLAYDNHNEAGVAGNCFDAVSCLFETTNGSGTVAQVSSLAHSATFGNEMAIPWSAINVDSNNLPDRIHIWTVITGNGDYSSNQSLPPMRPRSFNAFDNEGAPIKHMIGNLGSGPNDYSDGTGSPDRQADSYAAEYEVKMPVGVLCAAHDVNCDGSTNAGDIGIVASGANFGQNPPACDRADVDGSGGAVNPGDIGVIASGANFGTGTGPCVCETDTPAACGAPAR